MSATDDPLKEIIRIAPQMEEYHRMVGSQYWLPYLTSVTYPNLTSPVCNTDTFGLRYGVGARGERVGLKENQDDTVSVLVGGSTAFGIGCTSDAATIPSVLSREEGIPWINFGVRAYTITQSLVHFTLHQHLIGKVDRLVLMIGKNEIFSFINSLVFPTVLGTFPSFTYYMNALNPGYIDQENDRVLFPQNFLDANAFQAVGDPFETKDLLLNQVKGVLATFKTLAEGMGAEFSLAMQPVLGWHDRAMAEQEKALITLAPHLMADPELFSRQAEHYHRWWGKGLKDVADQLAIPFRDMNTDMENSGVGAEWLFVDDCHLTDLGNEVCAGFLSERSGL